MSRTRFILACLLTMPWLLFAQDKPEMVFVEGGSFTMGGGYQYYIDGYRMHLIGHDSSFQAMNQNSPAIGEIPSPNNPDRRVTVASFFMAKTEVTNLQYRTFLLDSLLTPQEIETYEKQCKAVATGRMIMDYAEVSEMFVDRASSQALLPDNACWTKDFPHSFNGPLEKNYFLHPAFNEYPVVGVTWDQANAYCMWLTNETNSKRKEKGLPMLPAYRLPTEAEWEYAALGQGDMSTKQDEVAANIYPFSGKSLVDDFSRYRMNTKVMPGDYIMDGYEYSNPVTAFKPNGFSLYGMGGNVSEWVADIFRVQQPPIVSLISTRPGDRQGPWIVTETQEDETEMRVAKGGSWADYPYAAMCGSRAKMDAQKGHSRVGFRVAQIKID